MKLIVRLKKSLFFLDSSLELDRLWQFLFRLLPLLFQHSYPVGNPSLGRCRTNQQKGQDGPNCRQNHLVSLSINSKNGFGASRLHVHGAFSFCCWMVACFFHDDWTDVIGCGTHVRLFFPLPSGTMTRSAVNAKWK